MTLKNNVDYGMTSHRDLLQDVTVRVISYTGSAITSIRTSFAASGGVTPLL